MPDNIPVIPEYITVHLGAPSSAAENVRVGFADYIKNVASSEIYPTWDEDAIRANVLAQISYTLNRVYTEYYPSRGYNFDITNDISIDQSLVYGRDIFENISRIVDEIFNSYIRRQGTVEPLFAVYCDGVEVNCGGLSQWGSQSLAEDGLSYVDILRRYYGNDIEIVSNAPVGGNTPSAPLVPLRIGSSGPLVQLMQIRLNRIATDYPAIPKIDPTDGIFGPETEEAVKTFQRIFNLTEDGVVGNATWYRINAIWSAVKRLSDLASEGLRIEEITSEFPEVLRAGDRGNDVRVLQYYLAYVSQFIDTVPSLSVDGSFGPSTENAVRAFQRTYGLPEDGVVGELTWDALYNAYRGFVASVPLAYQEGVTLPFPGVILKVGSEGEDVRLLQNYLNFIGQTYPSIPAVNVTGFFGNATANAVNAFTKEFGLEVNPSTVNSVVWDAITDIYEDLYVGGRASEGQFPGYTVGG